MANLRSKNISKIEVFVPCSVFTKRLININVRKISILALCKVYILDVILKETVLSSIDHLYIKLGKGGKERLGHHDEK